MYYLGTRNVALQQNTRLRVLQGPDFPSYRLVDGRIEQPSCVDFDPFPENNNFEFSLSLNEAQSIEDVKIHFIYEGIYNFVYLPKG
jgi:hypothetical protein